MPESTLMNIGDLARPATALIEKVSNAAGILYEPTRIRKKAKAEADAEIIRAQAQIAITDLQRRALIRLASEEAIKQQNIENIMTKALPQLTENSTPQDIENDWIANFFDKCKNVSDDEMQTLWARVLAGEANTPGVYSRRTINMLHSFDKHDAELFKSLCGFCCYYGQPRLLILDYNNPLYKKYNIMFATLKHLEHIGLVSFDALDGFSQNGIGKNFKAFYFGVPFIMEFQKEKDNNLSIGHVLLTQTGEELASVCGALPVDGFLDYAIAEWQKEGLRISSPYPRQEAKDHKIDSSC